MIEIFRPRSLARIIAQQLDDAERHAIEHEAAAEHHGALAAMYRVRVARLRAKAKRGEVVEFEFKEAA